MAVVAKNHDVIVSLATSAQASGAVAVIDLCGPTDALVRLLSQLTSRSGEQAIDETRADDWPVGLVFLKRLDDIDEGLAGRVTPTHGQLMPHGGLRVVRRLLDRLVELGAVEQPTMEAIQRYPEARDADEAQMLDVLARAASPAAIDVLLDQPALWRAWENTPASARESTADIAARSAVLDRLLMPPTVVVVGRPNVGKSTLANRVLGRSASLVADLPGTTRDWVGGLVTWGGVAIRWLDTPGLRASDDAVEQAAIGLARRVIEQADVLIRIRDGEHDWPDDQTLPRPADLHVINKIDLATSGTPVSNDHQTTATHDHDARREHHTTNAPATDDPTPSNTTNTTNTTNTLSISAITGVGLDALAQAVLSRLQLDVIPHGLWAYSDQRRAALAKHA